MYCTAGYLIALWGCSAAFVHFVEAPFQRWLARRDPAIALKALAGDKLAVVQEAPSAAPLKYASLER